MRRFSIVFLFLVLMPAASACLTTSETLEWYGIEQQLNISNNTLIDLAEIQCLRAEMSGNISGQLAMVNERIENLKDSIDYDHIDQKVDQRMNNYTAWFEREIGLNSLLLAIYNNTMMNMSNVDLSGYVTVSKFDQKVDELDRDIFNAGQDGGSYTGYTGYQANDPYMIIGFFAVLGLAVFYLWKSGMLKRFTQMQQAGQQPSPPAPQVQAGETVNPTDHVSVLAAREDMLKRFGQDALKKKVELLGAMRDKETDPKKIAQLEKDAKELIRQAGDG